MRPDRKAYFSLLAQVVSTRTTCIRRGVGCVVVDAKGHILGTGYNGVAAGMPHCNEGCPCSGHELPPGQDKCEAVHAEMNALLQCRDVWAIDTLYVTLSPCIRCTKVLLNTSCTKIVFLENHTGETGKALWEKAGRTWEQFINYESTKKAQL